MTLPEYLGQHYTPKTSGAYLRDIEAYTGAQRHAPTAHHADIAAYLGALRQRYSNPKSIARILASIKVYYDFLITSGRRTDHPARSLYLRDKTRGDVQLQDLFSTEELEKLLERKERFPLLTDRNRAMMSLLIYQGLLPTEMEKLCVKDINLDKAMVYVHGAAKTRSRELPIKPAQVMILYRYIKEVRPLLLKERKTEKLLVGIRGIAMPGEDITKHVMRTYRGMYPGRRVTVMTIRQSVICNLLKSGHDLRIVQTYAGHKTPSATERYRQTEVEKLRAALQKYHPVR